MSDIWVVDSLSLSDEVFYSGRHPESVPVGPFESQDAANEWAYTYICSRSPGGGGWSTARVLEPDSFA